MAKKKTAPKPAKPDPARDKVIDDIQALVAHWCIALRLRARELRSSVAAALGYLEAQGTTLLGDFLDPLYLSPVLDTLDELDLQLKDLTPLAPAGASLPVPDLLGQYQALFKT